MANVSLRLLTVFLATAIVLNVSNYLFVRVHNAARQGPYITLRGTINPEYWSAVVKCDDKNSSCATENQSNNLTTNSANYLMSKNFENSAEKELENCPELPPGLGPELMDRSQMATNLHYSKAKLDDVKPGGIYQPAECKSLQSVAIIIAYRGSKNYLTTFMNILHPFLIKQQLDYQIFVVEQSNKSQPYNRGKLLNVGFSVASRYRKNGFRCIILHEPNIVPLDTRNLYRCGWYPRQLATVVERPVKAPYQPLIGGAIALTPEQFLKFNGFSNAYWGNDADYYDLYNRINASNYFVENSFPLVGKYKTIRKGLALWHKSEYLSTPSPLYLLDGLTSLSYYVDSFELRRLFTYLQVNIDSMVETETRAKMYNKLLNPFTYKTTTQLKHYDMTLNNFASYLRLSFVCFIFLYRVTCYLMWNTLQRELRNFLSVGNWFNIHS